jgi:hypothetical protein
MTRTALPYQVTDISQLARQLARQLETALSAEARPGHLALLNILARAAGFRNYQHFRAAAVAGLRLAEPGPMPDMARVEQALRHFDRDGRMKSWPARTSQQHLCLWSLWARLPRGTVMTERAISAELNRWHLFGDAAILRRTLWELRLIHRSADSRDYRRIEQAPPPEAAALIRATHRPG